MELGLVDELVTSDDYLLSRSSTADLYTVSFSPGRVRPESSPPWWPSMTSLSRTEHPR